MDIKKQVIENLKFFFQEELRKMDNEIYVNKVQMKRIVEKQTILKRSRAKLDKLMRELSLSIESHVEGKVGSLNALSRRLNTVEKPEWLSEAELEIAKHNYDLNKLVGIKYLTDIARKAGLECPLKFSKDFLELITMEGLEE